MNTQSIFKKIKLNWLSKVSKDDEFQKKKLATNFSLKLKVYFHD